MIPIAILIALITFFFIILLGYAYFPGKHPLPTESDWTYHRFPWWQLYYASKFLAPVKKAARSSRLEIYFKDNNAPVYPEPLTERNTLTIKSVGDLMYRRDLATLGSPRLWDEIGPYLFSSDLTAGNMEFAVNEADVIEKLVRFSIPPAYAQTFLEAPPYGRFNLLFTANNHINDSLSAGIKASHDYLTETGIRQVGANRSVEDADSFPILECKGIKIAFLAYTFSTNGIPLEQGFSFGTNLVRFNALKEKDYDPSLVHKHIRLAKERGAELIIASHHWGVEFEYYPPARIVRRAHELLDAGLDIIIGHHPHILNPAEWYKTKDGRDTLCFYSLGNLTSSGLPFPIQKLSAIAEIKIETGKDKTGKKIVRPFQAGLTPVYFRTKKGLRSLDHRFLPVLDFAGRIENGTEPSFLSRTEKQQLLQLAKEYKKYFLQPKAFAYH